jgi:hypothetical protein
VVLSLFSPGGMSMGISIGKRLLVVGRWGRARHARPPDLQTVVQPKGDGERVGVVLSPVPDGAADALEKAAERLSHPPIV